MPPQLCTQQQEDNTHPHTIHMLITNVTRHVVPHTRQRTRVSAAVGDAASTGVANRTRRATRRSRAAATEQLQQQQQQPQAGTTAPQQPPTAGTRRGKKVTSAAPAEDAAEQQHSKEGSPKPRGATTSTSSSRPRQKSSAGTESHNSSSTGITVVQGPHVAVSQPLPHVLILHTGGTLGMDAVQSFEVDPHEDPHHPPLLKRGTGGIYGGESVSASKTHACRCWLHGCTVCRLLRDLLHVMNNAPDACFWL